MHGGNIELGGHGLAVVICTMIYLIVMVGIGIWSSRKQKNLDTFYVGERNFGPWIIAFAVSATTMSGFGFVGLPGLVYQNGPVLLWISIFATGGAVLSYFFLAKPMRRITKKFGALTMSDLLDVRYKSPWIRGVTALAILGGCVGYQLSQYKAMGNMLQTLLGVSYETGVFIGLVCIAVYVTAGGIISVMWTDLIQMSMMIFCGIFMFITGMYLVGGFSSMNATLASVSPNLVSAYWDGGGSHGILMVFSFFILYMIGHQAQPHVVTKFYMIKEEKQIKWSALVAAFVYACSALILITGLCARTLVARGQMPAPASPDLVIPMFMQLFLHPVMVGVISAAVLAAIMSTSSGFLIVSSAAIVRDFYQQLWLKGKDLPAATQLKLSRWVTFAVIIVTFLISLRPPDLIGWMGNASWGLFMAALMPSVTLGLIWKRATKEGAITSAAVGFVLAFVLYILKIKKIYVPSLDTGALATIVSFVVMVGVSLMTKQVPNPIHDQVPNPTQAAEAVQS